MNRSILISVWTGVALLATAACERPPVEADQLGYRGTGIVQISNPRLAVAAGEVPEALPAAGEGGPRAGDVYENVQVLDDLSVAEFSRLMAALTEWVSPEEGCNYCHSPQNLASDDVYTKVVSRRMLEMTRHINTAYAGHVGDTGVTCYTCHRGLNVPAETWTLDAGLPSAGGMSASRFGQNLATEVAAYSSLPYDPFERYLGQKPDADDIRVVSSSALPGAANPKNIKDTEATYGLMMHISDSLGVNCTYCHNTRSFAEWPQSSPVRVTAWYGLDMVQDLNETYLEPLVSALPEHRRGKSGDAPKAHCGTCHQGMPKPLGGAAMASAYPELSSE